MEENWYINNFSMEAKGFFTKNYYGGNVRIRFQCFPRELIINWIMM